MHRAVTLPLKKRESSSRELKNVQLILKIRWAMKESNFRTRGNRRKGLRWGQMGTGAGSPLVFSPYWFHQTERMNRGNDFWAKTDISKAAGHRKPPRSLSLNRWRRTIGTEISHRFTQSTEKTHFKVISHGFVMFTVGEKKSHLTLEQYLKQYCFVCL